MRIRLLLCIVAAMSLWACSSGKGGKGDGDGADSTLTARHPLPDTLRVATLYSPTSYFIYRDDEMGYDYALVKSMANEKGLSIDLKIAPSLPEAIAMLDSGLVDVIAYEVPVTSEYKEKVIACGPVNETTQVLVQPKVKGEGHISDVTELVGREVYVEADSKYLQRMQNLDQELGGGINIHTVSKDTLITEDLIEMVSSGEIPLTVVDSDIARINKTYYPDLDITMQVSFPQRSSWAVGKDSQWLADSINAWIKGEKPRQENASLLKRYFERSKNMPTAVTYNLDLSKGKVSPYDALFRKYAANVDYDWRLLAAQGFMESQFNSDVVSWAGARGIMQIMPRTATANGVSPDELVDPETSIKVASKIVASLDKSFASRVPDKQERMKFIVAAYNSGPAHIYDAIELAKKTGRDPQRWVGNVEEALLLKSNPEYYNDPVCKYGYFRGRQTTEYVKNVMTLYDDIKKKIH